MDTTFRNRYRKRTLKRITADSYAQGTTEHSQQVALFMWAQDNVQWYPCLRWMFAIPNGGLRDRVTASILKAEGVKRGVADIYLPFAVGNYHGLFIEMKRPKKSSTSNEQDEFKLWCDLNRFAHVKCNKFEFAKQSILNYLHHADKTVNK
jgi:Zn ribbon nucleic-acid-binding protein